MLARPARASTLYAAVFGLVGAWVGAAPLSDNSFFWHLRTGELILDSGFPRSDPFSFTARGANWVLQSWLAEVVDGLLDRAVGPIGIRLLGALLGAAVSVAVYALALRFVRRPATAAFLALPSSVCVWLFWSPRPLVWGFAALSVLVWVVEVPESRLGRRPLVVLPIVFALWANVHGSFALGVAYVGLHAVGRWLEGAPWWRPGRERALLAGTGIGVVLAFANPYGWRLVLFPLTPAGDRAVFRRIVEWQSPNFQSAMGVSFAGLLVVVLGCLALGRVRPGRRDVLVAAAFVLAALAAQRNVPLAALVLLPIAARAVAPAPEAVPSPSMLAGGRVALAALGVVGLLAVGTTLREPSFDFTGYPVRAYAALVGEGLGGGRLASTDTWGGWLILEHWPDRRVFIDDRYDMYPADVAGDYLVLHDGEPDWAEVLDRYEIETVLWPAEEPLAALLEESDGWRRVYRDDTAVVFTRA